jgi:hypothetical protein
MHQGWPARLGAWREKAKARLEKTWWLWPVQFGLELFWHQVHSSVNQYIYSQKWLFTWAKVVMAHVPSDVATVSVSLFVLTLTILALHAYWDSRREPLAPEALQVSVSTQAPTPAAALVVPDPSAPRESVERLQAVYLGCKIALEYAATYLGELCSGGLTRRSECDALISRLLTAQIIAPLERANKELALRLETAAISGQVKLSDLIGSFREAFDHYATLTTWIISAGELFVGKEQLLASEEYAKLYKYHSRCIDELRHVERRQDIGQVAVPWSRLYEILPPSTRLRP